MRRRDAALVPVYVELPNHWAVAGEALWALDLGDERYQLQTAPHYAYGLNCFDTVHATSGDPSIPLRVDGVVKRSGHATLRVMFFQSVPREQRSTLLEELATYDAAAEAVDERYFVIDVQPGADMAAIRRQLDAWEAAGMLEYETCEARQEDSFDDVATEES